MIRDWPGDASLIAHFLPGLGNPLRLTVPQFDAYLMEIPEVARIAAGRGLSDREYVEREMREIV